MMRKILLFRIAISVSILISCEDSKKEDTLITSKIDYSDKSVLDSLIRITPHSEDTLFLGFTIGMNKTDYKNHIQKLRSEGKTIDFSNSNKISTIAGTFDIGPSYTFKTSIATEYSDKTLTGEGKYLLEPVYNKKGSLMKLNILPIEGWNGDYGYHKPNWLENKITANSEPLSNENLKSALIENDFIDKNNFVRQKGNLIIYETSMTINYIDLKTLLLELLIAEMEKEIIEEENEDIKF